MTGKLLHLYKTNTMAQSKAATAIFKEQVEEKLNRFKPIIKLGPKYVLDVRKHAEQMKELEEVLLQIPAPGIDDKDISEIVSWAVADYDNYIKQAIENSGKGTA